MTGYPAERNPAYWVRAARLMTQMARENPHGFVRALAVPGFIELIISWARLCRAAELGMQYLKERQAACPHPEGRVRDGICGWCGARR